LSPENPVWQAQVLLAQKKELPLSQPQELLSQEQSVFRITPAGTGLQTHLPVV
jgi:hypothetical protein